MVLSLKERAENVAMCRGRYTLPVAFLFTDYLLPKHHPLLLLLRVAGAVHGRHVPPGAKEVHRLGEAIIVDEAGVHGEQPHQQQDVAAIEEHPQDLERTR